MADLRSAAGDPGPAPHLKRLPERPALIYGTGGTDVRDSLSPNLNDVTATKQVVTSATGMIVMASNNDTDRYRHATCRWDRRDPRPRVEAGLLAPRFQAQLIRRLLGRTSERFDASAHG